MLVTFMAARAYRDQVQVDRIGRVLVEVMNVQASCARYSAELASTT